MKNINIEKLVSNIKEIIADCSTVVELTDLDESSYNKLRNFLRESYEIKAIVTLLEGNERKYTLHISQGRWRD